MNQVENNVIVSSPEQAVQEFVGEQYIEWLMNYTAKQVAGWNETAEIRQAHPKIEKIRKFLAQVFLAEEAVVGGRDGDPGFLRFAIANLSEAADPAAEAGLEVLEKRRTDELLGHKIEKGIIYTHTRLAWLKLLAAVGLSEEEVSRIEPKESTRNLIAELSDIYSNAEWQTALGAFAGNERIMQEEYAVLIDLLKHNSEVSPKDLEILTRRQGPENKYLIESMRMLEKASFDQESKTLVWEGFKRALEHRQEFYQGLLKYLEN